MIFATRFLNFCGVRPQSSNFFWQNIIITQCTNTWCLSGILGRLFYKQFRLCQTKI